jgi:hypothetical protein
MWIYRRWREVEEHRWSEAQLARRMTPYQITKSLSSLEWGLRYRINFSEVEFYLGETGNIEILEYVKNWGRRLSSRVGMGAVCGNRQNVLTWLKENNLLVPCDLYVYAIMYGKNEMLPWIR